MKEKFKSLVYPTDCLKASIYCQIALRTLEDDGIEENQEGLDLWLQNYDSLYWTLTNQPPGLPAMPRTTSDGILYPALREFWRKYDRLRFPDRYNFKDLHENTDEVCKGGDESSNLL
jgi:hypothetical protein